MNEAVKQPPVPNRGTIASVRGSVVDARFEKHLPQATRAAFQKADTPSVASMVLGFSALTSQLNTNGQQLQTFEAGPTLLLVENTQVHTKFEIRVERDDLQGDEDDIELSFHGYKDGEPQTAGAKFRLTVTMKQEKQKNAAKAPETL